MDVLDNDRVPICRFVGIVHQKCEFWIHKDALMALY